MFSLPWIGIFVKVCAVKMGEGEKVLWKVRRHPVQNHPDAILMERVHQIHEILRRAVAAGGGVETSDLIPPGAVERKFGQRHEFHVGEPHLFHVFDQLTGEFAVGQGPVAILRHASPGAHVNFIHEDRFAQPVRPGSPLDPRLVAPFIFGNVPDDRGVIGRAFEVSPVRIGLQAHGTAARDNFVLVQQSFLKTRNENLPNTGIAQQPHRKVTSIPSVELAHHRHAEGVGRPDCKRDSINPVDLPRVGAEFLVNAMFGPFVEQVEILIAQRWKETVGVVELPDFTIGLFHSQPIAKDFCPLVDERLEKAQRLEFLHRISPSGLVLAIDDFAGSGVLHKSAHDEATPALVCDRVHAQKTVRLPMLAIEQRLQLLLYGGHVPISNYDYEYDQDRKNSKSILFNVRAHLSRM